MKYLLIFFLSVITLIKPEKVMAQYYPDFDELLDASFCKDSACFRKFAESKGFYHLRTDTVPGKNGFFIEYGDPKKEADGSINNLMWLLYNKKEGKSIYLSFYTTNLQAYTKLMNKMDERGFAFITRQEMEDDKERLMMSFWYRKGNTGIQTTISMTDTNEGEKEYYGFSVKIPVGDKWPAEY